MLYGICNLSIVPLRSENSDTSEMVSQVVFGEQFEILEKHKKWSRIKLLFDDYEGFIDNKQYQEIDEALYQRIASETPVYAGELIDYVIDSENDMITIPLGSRLPLFENHSFSINKKIMKYDGQVCKGKLSKSSIIQKAYIFLNSPYLWGGKTPFGIDCSGLTQLVYKLCGYNLPRDAKDQVKEGEILSFIEESEPGDLAFFDNQERIITHVGIIMKDYKIIHAHGKVRIDQLDHSGIYNLDKNIHTHKLRIIKKII